VLQIVPVHSIHHTFIDRAYSQAEGAERAEISGSPETNWPILRQFRGRLSCLAGA